MIKAVLVDDEKIALAGLATRLQTLCPQVTVLAQFDDPRQAVEEVPLLTPELVFLDIEMPHMNGFTLLKQLAPVQFDVIFTTAYSQYAIDALRISALDFLLKPIDPKELVTAVSKHEEKRRQHTINAHSLEAQLQLFFAAQQQPGKLSTIALPVLDGLEFIEVDSIVKVQGENVYSVFWTNTGRKIVVSRTLKETEQILSRWNFLRVHKSVIINLGYIKRYIKGAGGTVILTDGTEVEVSRRAKNEFLKRINEWS